MAVRGSRPRPEVTSRNSLAGPAAVPRCAAPGTGPALLALILTAALALSSLVLPPSAGASFTVRQEFGAGTTISVAWGDYDNDGFPDVAVGNSGGGCALYVNNGNGTFTGHAEFGADHTFAVVWGDFDNDGDLDIGVGNGSNDLNYIYVNNGDGTFAQGPTLGRKKTTSLAWGDYDNDGDLDIAVGNGILGTEDANRLFVNNGDGTFTSVAAFGMGQTASVVWGDFDNDGDLDLAVGNGGFGYIGQNYLYVNNGDGTFTERAEFGLGDTACLAWGDYDNDGDLDMAVANWNGGQSYLYINNGYGTFTAKAEFGMGDPNTVSWGDYDNDGDLDLAQGNGDFTSAAQNYLYINNGDGTFTPQPEFGLGSTDAMAWGDFDIDGDLDLAVGNEHHPTDNYLYVNNENDADFLSIHLVGHYYDLGTPYSNRDGIGAKVAVYEAGYLGDAAHLLGYREIEAHGGFSPQSQIDAHFGLPGRRVVDLRITWPGSGGDRIVEEAHDVPVGQHLTVHENEMASVPTGSVPTPVRVASISPNPFAGSTKIVLEAPAAAGLDAGIYDVEGRLVRSLAHGAAQGKTNGGTRTLEWMGTDASGLKVPPGIYFLRLTAGDPRQVTTRKLIRMR
jgi:FG-GAP-like repeat/ASPIC and UnbV/FlgD Ig-like domain